MARVKSLRSSDAVIAHWVRSYGVANQLSERVRPPSTAMLTPFT